MQQTAAGVVTLRLAHIETHKQTRKHKSQGPGASYAQQADHWYDTGMAYEPARGQLQTAAGCPTVTVTVAVTGITGVTE